MAALVLGVLALVTSPTIVGGVLIGASAIALGARGRAAARARGGSADSATAGIVLGGLGVAIAGGLYLWIADDLRELRGCQLESVSVAQDRACEQQFQRGITRR